MCTVSWSSGQEHLSLCFNRDERKTRSDALKPRILDTPGTKTIAAIDPDGGGTWLAVNEFGLCVYLLNNYAAEAKARTRVRKDMKSRGHLPLALTLFSKRREAVIQLRDRLDFRTYNPFLIVVADTEGAEAFAWDGDVFDFLKTPGSILTTSSFKTDEVQRYRKERYNQILQGRSSLSLEERRRFQTELAHEDPAFNPMMLREDARTHSVSTVEVGDGVVRYEYEAVKGDLRSLEKVVSVQMDLKK